MADLDFDLENDNLRERESEEPLDATLADDRHLRIALCVPTLGLALLIAIATGFAKTIVGWNNVIATMTVLAAIWAAARYVVVEFRKL